jgi:ATP-dependent DNA helicase RecG
MLDIDQIEALLRNMETDLIERKESLSDNDKVMQAICAYANDLPNHLEPGYIFVGVNDGGSTVGFKVDDRLLLTLSDIRDSGRILPLPHMDVHRVSIGDHHIAVVRVHPSDNPPVRLSGQVWIRVGPRRAIASAEEERRLTEKNSAFNKTFDRRPCRGATIEDILVDVFRNEYLPSLVSRETIADNHRELTIQLASLRLYDLVEQAPTNAGVLLIGRDPIEYFPGAYVQFVRFEGTTLADPVLDQKILGGNLMTQLRQLEELLTLQIRVSRVATTLLTQENVPDYPSSAIRELVLNAIMHRNYDGTSSPTRINWFEDRVEIQNPGGLYGHVTPANFTTMSDYRNPILAEAMKALGYVERFGVGISRAKAALSSNGNPEPEFVFEESFVSVTVRAKP